MRPVVARHKAKPFAEIVARLACSQAKPRLPVARCPHNLAASAENPRL